VPLGVEGQKAAAIIESWYGGERGGEAIADVLKGAYNPGGRLPITIYRSAGQLPPFTDYAMRGRTYRYFVGSPEYPFGYGLSYTRFAYSGLTLGQFGASKTPVTVRVRNNGVVAGDEVVQLYVSPAGRPDAPSRSLKGFERIHLAPSEERKVTFELDPRDVAFADAAGVMRVAPGELGIWVGGGQPGQAPGQSASLHIAQGMALQP
jgi:beta-glucosidase